MTELNMSLSRDADDARAEILLAQLTARQLREVTELIMSTGDGVHARVAAVRKAAPTPPLLAVVDSPALSPQDMAAVLAAMTIHISDDIAAPADADSYATVLVRGFGMPEKDAEALAESIETPDSAHTNAALRVLEALPDINAVQDDAARRAITQAVVESVSLVSRLFGKETRWKDSLYEWLKMGRGLYEYNKRVSLQGVGYAFSYATAGVPEAGDPLGDDDEMGDYAGMDLGSSINQLVGWPMYPEAGDPFTAMSSEAARDTVRGFNSVVQQAMTSPYHDFAAANPEQGGLFGSIGKFIKKASRVVKSVVKPIARTVAPMVGTAIGSMYGQPELGRKFASNLTEDVMSGNAFKNPLKMAGWIAAPAAMMNVSGMTTPTVNRMVQNRRTAPRSVPLRMTRPIAAGGSGLIGDIIGVLQSHGLR